MTVALHREGYWTARRQAGADINPIPIVASPTPPSVTMEVISMGVDIEVSGWYEVTCRVDVQCGSGNAFNEVNWIIAVDDVPLRPRTNASANSATVSGRWTHTITNRCFLAEGGHYFRVGAWSFNTTGILLRGSGGDDDILLTVKQR